MILNDWVYFANLKQHIRLDIWDQFWHILMIWSEVVVCLLVGIHFIPDCACRWCSRKDPLASAPWFNPHPPSFFSKFWLVWPPTKCVFKCTSFILIICNLQTRTQIREYQKPGSSDYTKTNTSICKIQKYLHCKGKVCALYWPCSLTPAGRKKGKNLWRLQHLTSLNICLIQIIAVDRGVNLCKRTSNTKLNFKTHSDLNTQQLLIKSDLMPLVISLCKSGGRLTTLHSLSAE